MSGSRPDRRVVHWTSARVLLFHTSGRLLLVGGGNPERPQAGRWWFPVGGGVEKGEDLAVAIGREVREETGIVDVRLGPLVWQRTAGFPYRHDRRLVQREHYFVGWTGTEAVRLTDPTAYERRQSLVLRWWEPTEISGSRDTFAPPQLPELLGDVRAGRFPADPIELDPHHVD